ncbi:hypothetical protein [Paludisphaera rhizosphaerae]|uniref:hypothetical protein n=1 Tax=Paludisphaera rhizosphaerae TaxID=2711216 RepID=UPI0019804AE8|nr:hypothetical protein [Paludisphaera rhizosphaerae]
MALGLKELREQTWDLDPYDLDGVFVSPSVLGWTFILGHDAGWSGNPGPDTEISQLLCDLSRRFGEAQFFTNHRVVSLAGWARAVEGQIVRAYVNADDVRWDEGGLTDEERELGFENFVRLDTKVEELGELDIPDESDVMTLAGRWSINPEELDAYESEGPGFLGDLN